MNNSFTLMANQLIKKKMSLLPSSLSTYAEDHQFSLECHLKQSGLEQERHVTKNVRKPN